MRIGCPKEIKTHEYRVGLTPDSVPELVHTATRCGRDRGRPRLRLSDEEYAAPAQDPPDRATCSPKPR